MPELRGAEHLQRPLGVVGGVHATRVGVAPGALEVGDDLAGKRKVDQMKRTLMSLAAVYLLFAVIGRFVEGMGAVDCGCADDCWCKRPVLSTFRWVFPFGHRGQSQAD